MCAGKEEGIALTTLSPLSLSLTLPSSNRPSCPVGPCNFYWKSRVPAIASFTGMALSALANKTSISEPAPSPSSRASLSNVGSCLRAAEEMLARGLPVQHGVPELEHSLPGGCSYICVTNCYMAAKMHTHLLLTNRRRGTRALSRGPIHMEKFDPFYFICCFEISKNNKKSPNLLLTF